jgi:hypothetical protein
VPGYINKFQNLQQTIWSHFNSFVLVTNKSLLRDDEHFQNPEKFLWRLSWGISPDRIRMGRIWITKYGRGTDVLSVAGLRQLYSQLIINSATYLLMDILFLTIHQRFILNGIICVSLGTFRRSHRSISKKCLTLKWHSHEKVFEIISLNYRLGSN